MTGEELLAALRARDVRVSVAGDRLVINAPRGTITTELHAALVGRKPEILALLRSEDRHVAAPPGPAALPPSWRERIAYLDHARWVRWRHRSTEIQEALGRPPTVAAIHAADRQAAVEVLAEVIATGAASRRAKPEAGPELRPVDGNDRPPSIEPVSEPSEFPWQQVLPTWPIAWRERWGRRANALRDEGLDWRAAEARAFDEVRAVLPADLQLEAAPEPEAEPPTPADFCAAIVWTAAPMRWRCWNPYCLHKTGWWRSAHGVINCTNCRPPSFPELVVARGTAADAPLIESDQAHCEIQPPSADLPRPGAQRDQEA